MVYSNPRICLLTETYYPVVGGGETQARVLAEDLVGNDFEVIVITRRSSSSLKKIEDMGKIRIYRIPPVGNGHFRRWGMLLPVLAILVKMHRQYDVIFVSGFKVLGIPAVLVSKMFHKACILKADNNGEMSGEWFVGGLEKLHLSLSSLPVRIFLTIRNKILRNADVFVAISSSIATELTARGVNFDTIHYIPTSVDVRKFCPVSDREKYMLRDKLTIPQKDIIIIFTGRLVSWKGLPLLMKVWKEIYRKHKHVRLLLVGAGGTDIYNCEVELKEYVRSNGLQESVYFAGEVRNVHEYLQASDIFVFPTENDAFPSSLIEAMACGLPVISTPISGIKDIITHKQNGLLVEVGNFQQLHDAIYTLITNTSLSDSLRKAALQTVQDRCSREIVSQKYIELFRHVFRERNKK